MTTSHEKMLSWIREVGEILYRAKLAEPIFAADGRTILQAEFPTELDAAIAVYKYLELTAMLEAERPLGAKRRREYAAS